MPKVLVVDDEQDIRDLLVDILSEAGYEAIEAKNGDTAIEKARLEHPDVILLDVWMPIMDGFVVLKSLKNNPTTQSISVIMVSAKGQEQD